MRSALVSGPNYPNNLGVRYRYAAAVAAGLVLACAFPTIGVAGLAWVAPGLILAPALGVTGRIAFRLGYVSGLIHHLVSLSWLLYIPVFKLAPATGLVALSAFLALYQAAWVWVCWRIYPRRLDWLDEDRRNAPRELREDAGGAGPVGESAGVLERFLEVPWGRRLVWGLTCAALWVAGEMIQARFLSGFPWNLLGSSQFRMTPVIQVASVTGIYGVSFLTVWFGVSLLMAGVVVLRRSQTPRRWLGEVAVVLLVLAAVIAHGYSTVLAAGRTLAGSENGEVPLAGPSVRLALVQPSIPQQWIWNSRDSTNRFGQLLQLSEAAMARRPDVVVWPEAAVPGFVRFDTNTHDAVVRFAQTNRVWLILGADDASPRAPFSDEYDVFNASFLVSPAGEFVERYAKQRLVMFGEYLPFVRWLPFLERWTGMGSFTPGSGPVEFVIPKGEGRPRLKTSVLICFEDVFPHGARTFVEADTDFLLNLTNNGWFGESAAQWQHAAAAVFRAVENGLPLVRCANNGLTCWVDEVGRMREVYFPGTTDIYGRGIKVADVPVLGGRARARTFYSRHGDVFGWGCVAWVGLVAARAGVQRRRAGGVAGELSGGAA